MASQETQSSTTKKRSKVWLVIGIIVFLCVCLPVSLAPSDSEDEDARTESTQRPVKVSVEDQTARLSRTPAPTRTSTVPPTATLTPTAVPTIDTSECQLGAAYVADVTIPDNTSVETGSTFVKTWRVRNTGACEWGPGYTLAFVGGDALGEGAPVDVPETVPGADAEVSVRLLSPDEPGRYRGEWQLCVNDTECFGQKLDVLVIATLPPSPTPRPTRPPTATPLPETAGVTKWLVYDDEIVGVREVAWSYRIGYYRPEAGRIFVSMYILAVNTGSGETRFWSDDFGLVDGGGEIHGELLLPEKEPGFGVCAIKPGGVCEGWWTTSVWDRAEVRTGLNFRWDPGLFDPILETEILADQ